MFRSVFPVEDVFTYFRSQKIKDMKFDWGAKTIA